MLSRTNRTTLTVLATCLIAGTAPAIDIMVPVDQPTIQDAINVAFDGDTVTIQPGLYFEMLDMQGKGIILRGNGAEPNDVKIDASAAGPVITGLGTAAGPDTVIANLTLRNGSVGGSGGAARIVFDANPTFRRVRFVSNDAGAVGGAVDIFAATATFVDCKFLNNSAGGSGGAVNGDARFRNCEFRNNFADGNGGAVQSSGSTYVNCLFHDNEALGEGGALYLSDDDEVINCTLTQNLAGSGGESIHVGPGGSPLVANCLVGGSPAIDSASGDETVTYTNTESGVYPGLGNTSVLPQWVDAANDDFRLLPTSPAIDAGETALYEGPLVDLDRNPRGENDPATVDTGRPELGFQIDMGAYEFQPASSGCSADITGDGEVGVDDLLLLLGGWGVCP